MPSCCIWPPLSLETEGWSRYCAATMSFTVFEQYRGFEPLQAMTLIFFLQRGPNVLNSSEMVKVTDFCTSGRGFHVVDSLLAMFEEVAKYLGHLQQCSKSLNSSSKARSGCRSTDALLQKFKEGATVSVISSKCLSVAKSTVWAPHWAPKSVTDITIVLV